MMIKRVLISVYDKTGILNLARELEKIHIEIIATGGTFEFLRKGGIQRIKRVSDVTKFPEILGGRIKTEHPIILGGILALRDNKKHINELKRLGIKMIDMVVCNLYPFNFLINQEIDLNTALEKIDIGGPNLIRAAAKNFINVTVIVNPDRYSKILKELKKRGNISARTKYMLAIEAFKEIARYDCVIRKFFENRNYYRNLI